MKDPYVIDIAPLNIFENQLIPVGVHNLFKSFNMLRTEAQDHDLSRIQLPWILMKSQGLLNGSCLMNQWL